MPHTNRQLSDDIDKIQRIPIVKTILNVICETTGMGFAAVARVTEDRWIACSVRDDIQFGLKPGEELKIETTICNEIQEHHQVVVIDHVAQHELYRHHHTPKLYGFQSYISVPILMQDGSFFGTLCAIDPVPHQLDNEKVIGMFKLFAELISFHLATQRQLEQDRRALLEMEQLLTQSQDVNNQYQYISNHNLREPLRKMRVFASMITLAAEAHDTATVKTLAAKVESNAENFINLIDQLTTYAAINDHEVQFERVDLGKIIHLVADHLQVNLSEAAITVSIQDLPFIYAVPRQMERLFTFLFNYLIRSKSSDRPVVIEVGAAEKLKDPSSPIRISGTEEKFLEICIGEKEVDLKKLQTGTLPDFFTTEISMLSMENHKKEMSYCRRIVQRHGGKIIAYSVDDDSTGFCLALPVREIQPQLIKSPLR